MSKTNDDIVKIKPMGPVSLIDALLLLIHSADNNNIQLRLSIIIMLVLISNIFMPLMQCDSYIIDINSVPGDYHNIGLHRVPNKL